MDIYKNEMIDKFYIKIDIYKSKGLKLNNKLFNKQFHFVKYFENSRIDGCTIYLVDYKQYDRELKLKKLTNIINGSKNTITNEFENYLKKNKKHITIVDSIVDHIINYYIKYPNGIK